MLIRETRRLLGFVSIAFIVGYIGFRLYFDNQRINSWIGDALWSFNANAGEAPPSQPTNLTSTIPQGSSGKQGEPILGGLLEDVDPLASHNEVFSASTRDRKFFSIQFGNQKAMNPNIIPHPLRENTWIIVAQRAKGPDDVQAWFTEIVCSATFRDDGGTLACDEDSGEGLPTTLPIAATTGDKCVGDLGFFGLNVGPHDARVFFGPRAPYALYGSQSSFTCFGQWVQDFRVLFPWGLDMTQENRFHLGTELQRPSVQPPSPSSSGTTTEGADHQSPPQPQQQQQYFRVEKNWFLFWDRDGNIYVHYDIAPRRVFAALRDDGSAGPDLAPLAQPLDEKCLARRLPPVAPTLESLHQSTNSLSITLCRRADATSSPPSCVPSDDNTFVFTLFHHKSFYDFHGVYEPYLLLFRQRAPFEAYAVSRKPVWIHGRERRGSANGTADAEGRYAQMLYVVSMSWKARGQKYHGYLDDVLFLAFGIEDREAAGIDVVAGDLLKGLGLCSDD